MEVLANALKVTVQIALRRYSTRDEALNMLEQEYGTRIPRRHPHFIMGTMKLHPRNFILIGLLRTRLDPDDSTSRARCSSWRPGRAPNFAHV